MKSFPFRAVLLSLGLGLIGLIDPGASVQAQLAGSPCWACHEVEGRHPVSQQGAWHRQHSFGDLCVACHGGNPQAVDQALAHVDLVNPLVQAEARCGACHPDDYAARAQAYAQAAGPTATPAPMPTPPPALAPTARPTVAVEATAPSPTMTAPAAPIQAPNPPGAGTDWLSILRFVRGPLFRAALWFFAVGMLVRLGQIIRLGWKPRAASRNSRPLSGVIVSYLKGLLIWPYIPWMKGVFQRNALIYAAGGLFHLGLLATIFFSRTHMLVWQGLIGISWPTLPPPAVAGSAAGALVAMLVLFANRLVHPVLRLLSGPAEWLNWLLVFLPMLTGFLLARRWWLPYEAMFSVHMLAVDVLLVWIPLSRISHFLFYFFSRTAHGLEFGRRADAA